MSCAVKIGRMSVLFAVLFVSNHAFSQIQFQSLQEVLNFADNNSFTIQSAQVQQEIDKTNKQQAQSFLYPTVNAVSGLTDNITLQPTLVPNQLLNPSATDDEYTEMTFGKKYVYTAGVIAQWDVLNFQRIFSIQMANLQLEAGEIKIQKAKFDTYNQLASLYYSILLAQKSIEIFTENVAVTDSLQQNAHEKYAKGIISEEELNRVSIQHFQNQKNLQNVQNSLQQLVFQIQTLLNTKEEVQVSGNLETPIVLNSEITAVSPDVLWQESQVSIYKSQLKQNNALFVPSLSFQYQYNYNFATNDIFNFSNVNKLPSQLLGIKLTIPLFNGFSTSSKVKASKTQLELQEMQLKNVQLSQQKEDEALKLQYKQAIYNLSKDKEILELQHKNDVHIENKYESGVVGLDERMTKYNDLLTAQYGYLQSLADFSLAQYKIYIRQLNFQ